MAITDRARPLWRKILWFAGLWLAGVIAVTAFAYTLRFLMDLAGL